MPLPYLTLCHIIQALINSQMHIKMIHLLSCLVQNKYGFYIYKKN